MSKVVIAEYIQRDVFKLPKGLDLEDKEQVKDWGIKWNRLWIVKTDGTELKITSEGYIHRNNDYERPDNVSFDNKDNYYGMEFSDDDDEEEEEQYGTCIKCGIEGKFIGKQDDEWTCIQCLN